jgi:hypothetical protein
MNVTVVIPAAPLPDEVGVLALEHAASAAKSTAAIDIDASPAALWRALGEMFIHSPPCSKSALS